MKTHPLDETLWIAPEATIHEAMRRINASALGIVLVLDAGCRLLDTLTDGDLRRAILDGSPLDAPVRGAIELKGAAHPHPCVAPVGSDPALLLALMRAQVIRQIPLIDAERRVTSLVTMDDLLPEAAPLQAVVMAGGFGSRLMPLTDELPKPMLHVGDKPILEHIVGRLQQAGIRRVSFTTHYRPEAIEAHFGGGENFGLEIAYVNEDQPLGTAGALSMLAPCEEPMLVMNGDILTRVDFRAMLAFHREHGADLTVGVRQYDMSVPYGVVRCDGASVRAIEEKPVVNFLVNAGIYLIEPAAHRRIPAGQRFDMTDLIAKLTAEGRSVAAFPIVEYWLDIGRHGDYSQAQQDFKSWEAAR